MPRSIAVDTLAAWLDADRAVVLMGVISDEVMAKQGAELLIQVRARPENMAHHHAITKAYRDELTDGI